VIRVDAGDLQVAIDLDRHEATLRFGSSRPLALRVPGSTGRTPVISRGAIKTACGPAERVEIQTRAVADFDLRWVLEIDREGRGLTSEVHLENRSLGPASWTRDGLQSVEGYDPECHEDADRAITLAAHGET